MRSDQHMPPSGSTANPPSPWNHDFGGAPGTEDHVRAYQWSLPSTAAEMEVTTLPEMATRPVYLPGQLALGEPAVSADESQSILSTDPPATGQSDAMLVYLVGQARDQHESQELLPVDYAKNGLANTVLEEDVEDLVDAEFPREPRRQKTRQKKSKDEVEEPPRAGDTALIVKGIHAECGRDDVYAMLQESGFANTFDILYLPKNFANHQNRGYFHVNFKEAADAESFSRLLQSRPGGLAKNWAIARSNSRLVAYRARYQGLCNFVMDLVSNRKLRAVNKEHLPWIYLQGSSCPLTKEMAERLLSSEFRGSGGAQSSVSSDTAE